MMLTIGDPAPVIVGEDERGELLSLPISGSWTHLWFNPIFGRYGCKDCQTSLIHELFPELLLAECQPVGLTYDSPQANRRRNAQHLWRIPLVQISMETAAAWGVLRDPKDPWYAHTPRSTAFLVHPRGSIHVVFERVSHFDHAQQVLDTLKSTTMTGG
jgi:peroxiredoxin